jgi:hypothetical protein
MIPEFELTVVRGTLTFPGADYENVFGPAGAIALLRQDSDLLILPIHQAVSGGHLVSRSGVDGARAVDALEFFRQQQLDSEYELRVCAHWNPERSALCVRGLFGCHA